MRIVGCFLEFNGKFVILLRHAHKPNGNTWGLPSGKVEAGEQDSDAMIRELREETGYHAAPNELEHLGTFDFTSDQSKNYTFVTYHVQLKDSHDMQLETAAHAEYRWVTAKECYAMQDLIPDFHTLLKLISYV
jgi:8-oxo-dGTP diphosphatase